MLLKNRVLFFLFIFTACVHHTPHQQNQNSHHRWPVMGTFFEVTWMDHHVSNQSVSQKMFEQVQLVDEKVSTYKSKSDLSIINTHSGSNQWISIHPVTQDLLEKSAHIQKQTSGYFDIAVGPLVHLWKLNLPVQGREYELPTENEIERKLSIVKNTKIDVEKLKARVIPEGALLDMGGIAKGYALDLAYSVHPNGHCGFINLGRQMMVVGQCSTPLRFGIQNPQDSSRISATIDLSKGSISTTGGYERYFISKGKKYGHILNPKNGGPVESKVESVTVWAIDGTTADAWSTALYVAGMTEGMKMIQDQKVSLGVLWILENNKLVYQDSTFGKVNIPK